MNENTEEEKVVKMDDPVVVSIMIAVQGGNTPTVQDVARQIADEKKKPKDGPDLWRRYMKAVKQQAIHMARAGRIEIIRKGEAIDPREAKGLFRLRSKQD
ncbi:MAG: DUF3253 domain-containing protein [Rhodospirillaceae bacterium]|jgi:hypothetical protein|nr:DUF3253 domain-containing protein [Rhodospirillaceae bacterium]MBT4220041.1 DUF3253 domain-containing protein [Rhodospirillaceae bacterium]MBT4463418.1 DUF3253 domain-containing protein [Rhodospirillaceae bacterium]MBT5308979.1 DUF3253 domain-containing protein [Rhodospirillaceae bacterium]MBT6407502.1 DUF3253 domain-containing protein [Rhodospirillaceae bacterium]